MKEAKELAKQHTAEPTWVYGTRVAQAWEANVMVDETTELILTK